MTDSDRAATFLKEHIADQAYDVQIEDVFWTTSDLAAEFAAVRQAERRAIVDFINCFVDLERRQENPEKVAYLAALVGLIERGEHGESS